MKSYAILTISLLALSRMCMAQDIPVDVIAETPATPQPTAEHKQEVIEDKAAEATPASDTPQAELSPGEQRLQAGIVMLGNLYNLLSGIRDNESAEKAVAPLMRLSSEMNLWAQGFTSLPPMTENEQVICEDRYLPIIRKINMSIKVQGERLASAEYYGSQNLPAALVRLAILNQ